LFFYCELPPESGGETPLCLSNVAYERIKETEPSLVEELETKGVRYSLILPDRDDFSTNNGRGWQSAYLTNSKEEAEKILKEQEASYTWLPNGSLQTVSKILPPIRIDKRTGKKNWFNNIVAAFSIPDLRNDPKKVVTMGDEETFLDSQKIQICQNIINESAVSFKWEKHDVLLLDNNLVLHARNSYFGNRRVLAALFE
jgi:hypothetical protein